MLSTPPPSLLPLSSPLKYALYYSYSPLLTPPPASSSVWACTPEGFLSTASEPHMLERQPGQPGIGVLVVVVVVGVVVL
ncbi:unnamed protein product, partial [Gadus morhua 'NCC']